MSDKVVAQLYLKAFARSAAGLMDWTDITAANTSFFASYVFDDRWDARGQHMHGCSSLMLFGGFWSLA